ncbi:3-hydroxyacyl-[acyl-carrier-protein] dehydratase [Weissella beninensis]|uniref:3-hydroxyacyl-[acyl-carrier-protein] dehydratase n=1 Tax=Periweissella beninensis TaxID=504936 RepID=A0ABT0VFV7_9LACO|nr:3-hydroxyacyl-ACP dehydratase FabZ [Periweissella beninensis]MBM7543523.1 3-hydroxyacyl-[acyl-carrier-protein] dehydratase [Periweissella beninensis]MCM2436505.1 3-hydroxyacyl-ACP dehydratase FabZ [Periweissella beninensis]
MAEVLLDTVAIQKILPHRYPMLMIDQVIGLEPGKSATALKNVSINEEIFKGHFPGDPVLPGALVIEALAQTGAVALLSLPEFEGKTVYFGGIKSAKFRKMTQPGTQLRLEVTMEKIRGNIGSGKGIAYIGDKKAVDAQLTFMIG